MGFLDAYDTYVNNKCDEIEKENSTFESLTSALGLSKLLDGVKGFYEGGITEALLNSPLRTLAEDLVAQTIHENSRALSQNILNAVEDFDKRNRITATLTDMRALAFNAVTTALTFQNDMVLFFAAQVAQKAVKAIDDKRQTLIELQEAIRRLHNALLTLAGGGPFFNQYLADLRAALVLIHDADVQMSLVESAFSAQSRFPRPSYERAKTYLDQAYNLIMPGPTSKDTTLLEGLMKGKFVGPDLNLQKGMLLVIPKLTMEMLKKYDYYALKVIKVNLLILGFQNVIQNLKEVTGDKFKTIILDQIRKNRAFLSDIIESMALELNGDIGAIRGPIQVPAGSSGQRGASITSTTQYKTYSPNPTIATAKATVWSVKVKAARVMLETIDVNAMQNISISNNALAAYNKALEGLSKLDDRVSRTAVLRATDGREQPGDLEADFVTFAFQANQAILDSSLLESENGRFSSNTVLALGAKLIARTQLSITQDREVQNILYEFIAATENVLKAINDLGNSIFKVMDDLGMDRAKDFLQNGDFGGFFAMTGQTSTYIGAAMTGLSFAQALLSDSSQKTCLNTAVNTLKTAQTSKDLAAARTVTIAFPKQQERNTAKCEKLRNDSSRVDRCSSSLDLNALRDNPLRSLSGVFRGIFGGDIAETLGASPVAAASAALTKKIADEAKADANEAESGAKKEMADALESEGVSASEDESLNSLKKKTDIAKETATGDNKNALENASVTGRVAQMKNQSAGTLIQKANITPNIFGA